MSKTATTESAKVYVYCPHLKNQATVGLREGVQHRFNKDGICAMDKEDAKYFLGINGFTKVEDPKTIELYVEPVAPVAAAPAQAASAPASETTMPPVDDIPPGAEDLEGDDDELPEEREDMILRFNKLKRELKETKDKYEAATSKPQRKELKRIFYEIKAEKQALREKIYGKAEVNESEGGDGNAE